MKKYNTPHRRRVIKTRLTEEEYAEFSERVTLCKMSQAEFIRQALTKSRIRPVITVSPVNDAAISAAAIAAAVQQVETAGDGLPGAGSRHAIQIGLGQHVALNAVQTAVKRAAAVGELFGHIVNQSLGKNLRLQRLVLHLQVEDLFGLLCLIDAAGLPHYSVPAVPDGKTGGLALLLSQILGTRAVDDLPLLHLAVGYPVTAALRGAAAAIAPAAKAAAEPAAQDGPDHQNNEQYADPTHAGLGIFHLVHLFFHMYSNGLFQPGEFSFSLSNVFCALEWSLAAAQYLFRVSL